MQTLFDKFVLAFREENPGVEAAFDQNGPTQIGAYGADYGLTRYRSTVAILNEDGSEKELVVKTYSL